MKLNAEDTNKDKKKKNSTKRIIEVRYMGRKSTHRIEDR